MKKLHHLQEAVLEWVVSGSGHAIVEAVAGSGKTTTIIAATAHMQGRVALLAFNAKIAKELASRVVDNPACEARTLHSAGFASLRASGWRGQVKADHGQRLADQLAPPQLEGQRKVVSTAAALASMAKQRGFDTAVGPRLLDHAAWEAMAWQFEIGSEIEDEDFAKARDLAVECLLHQRTRARDIDFDDQLWLPLVRGLEFPQYDWVVIDEAQDTNPARRGIALAMLKPGGRFLAVGDPCQAIYGFTGCDNDSLEQIRERLQAITLPLSVSFRCPQAVVNHAREVVAHIEAHPEAPEGEVVNMSYDAMLAALEPGQTVLCRVNKPLVQAAFALIRAGKPAKIEGRAIAEGLLKLTERWKVTDLGAFADKLDAWEARETDRALSRKQSGRALLVQDQAATMRVLIERTEEIGGSTIADLQAVIHDIFTEATASNRFILLCSVHRSKGLEWPTVYLLGREKYMPHPMAKQPWEQAQEQHLIYVAITRAQARLVEVPDKVQGEQE